MIEVEEEEEVEDAAEGLEAVGIKDRQYRRAQMRE